MTIAQDLAVIQTQRTKNGLYLAGGGQQYQYVWIRDNVYVALALEASGETAAAAQVYEGLCGIIERYTPLLESDVYPEADKVLHPRFTPDGEEVGGSWSNKQHDAVGALLFGIGQLAQSGHSFSARTLQIAQKLVRYLETCNYPNDADNGMWEEALAVHASSLAACIRGIESVAGFCQYSAEMLATAKQQLEQLLPNESETHDVDMALLSLVWPYGYSRPDIVAAVESRLVRPHGVIRYEGDVYEAEGGEEPQWVMGLPWLGIAHFEQGNKEEAQQYLERTEVLYTENGLPESYRANNRQCAHTPLAWSHAMTVVLRAKLAQ